MEDPRSTVRSWHGALLGLVTAAIALGVAQLVAGLLDPQTSPFVTVGQAAIDATPEWLKAWAIRTFGSRDKDVLLGGMSAVLLTAALGLGVVAIRRPRVAIAGLVVFGAIGAVAAMTRPAAGMLGAAPAVAGTVAAVIALRPLRRRMLGIEGGTTSEVGAGAVDRRRFLLTAAGGLGVAIAAGGIGATLGRRFRADDSRASVSIPAPDSPETEVAGVDPGVAGAEPYLTPNDAFYRVDTALLVPSVQAEDWTLRIHGMVDHELEITYANLLERPPIERDITLACVSNEVGGRYVGNARWIGIPLNDILEEAGVRPGADQLVSRSADGWTAGTPTAIVTDGRDAMLAIAMNGEPLPLAHGFPVRMVVPGLYGYVSATKWVVDLELTTFAAFDPYWIGRGWSEQAPIKTMSRIDTPRDGANIGPGEVAIAGVAWAQHTGIEAVEVSIDDGPWMPAELADEASVDTWRLWVHRWQASTGEHRIAVRATDRDGMTQTSQRVEPFPDGATGHHTIAVNVR